MSKKVRISEEQYNRLVAEDITLNADVAAANGDIKKAVDNTRQEAQKNGIDLNKASIQIPGNETNENKLITKQTLIENRLKVLKEHSTFYRFEDFIKNK